MASPETIGQCACGNCGASAYVKKNRGGFPYYRCGACDHESRQHSQKGARLFLAKVSFFETDEKPAAPANATPEKPAKTKPPAGSFAGMLGL